MSIQGYKKGKATRHDSLAAIVALITMGRQVAFAVSPARQGI